MTQAIQVKYVNNARGVFLTATAKSGNLSEPRNYAINVDQQARELAQQVLVNLNWSDSHKITGSGILPNGDDVFTIGVRL
tara:strand:+ start:268 stop:507 length:240 start_codon:yes stop_codon:yes gene_type:complete